MREEGCEVGPGFGVCGKGLVHGVRVIGDEGVDASIVEVHGVGVTNQDTANTLDDDIEFVASVVADGKVAGMDDAIEDGAGFLSTRVRAGAVIVASIVFVTATATLW